MSKKKNKRTYYKRKGRRNRHHILAKSRGGEKTESNLILLDENRHAAYHLLFGLRTFEEAARLLMRVSQIKNQGVIFETV